jgi:hypothetical protein
MFKHNFKYLLPVDNKHKKKILNSRCLHEYFILKTILIPSNKISLYFFLLNIQGRSLY